LFVTENFVARCGGVGPAAIGRKPFRAIENAFSPTVAREKNDRFDGLGTVFWGNSCIALKRVCTALLSTYNRRHERRACRVKAPSRDEPNQPGRAAGNWLTSGHGRSFKRPMYGIENP
jgi:hypothetical protein